MVSNEIATENNQVKEDSLKTIPRGLLVHVYWILPVLLGVVLYDMFYLDQQLLPYLGIEGLFLPLFIFIFQLPHIIASFFSFFDREYMSYYKKYLFGYLPLLLIATGILMYFDYILGLVFYLLSDMWHGVKQKVGIALILGAKPNWVHRVWTLSAFFLAGIAYVYIMRPSFFPDVVLLYLSPALLIGAVLLLLFMTILIWQSTAKVRWYIFAVTMLFILSYFFILAEYIFFSILAFRFVHDISAFAFYITHDHNRKLEGQKNWLYKLLAAIPVPTLLLTPLFALLFGYLINRATEGVTIGYSIIVLIGMAHFFLESVMWKRNSLHRKRVRVT